MDYWTAKALLEWQVELGADEAILDAPLDRYGLTDPVPRAPAATSAASTAPAKASDRARPALPPQEKVDPVAVAAAAAALAEDLEGLRAALAAFELCEIKKGARSLVFAAGDPGARVLILTEPPDREDDLAGRPFAGRAGQLLDRMLGAIGLSRDGAGQGPGQARTGQGPGNPAGGEAKGQGQGARRAGREDGAQGVYIVPVLPWRLPADRAPEAAELAIMRPFLERHVELAAPDLVVLMGNGPCQALLGRGGISGLRGRWASVAGRPSLPMFHPAALMRRPEAKRAAWADLLELAARLRGDAQGQTGGGAGGGTGGEARGEAGGAAAGRTGADPGTGGGAGGGGGRA